LVDKDCKKSIDIIKDCKNFKVGGEILHYEFLTQTVEDNRTF
jgi:hypothetical protein